MTTVPSPAGLEALDEQECLRLLGGAHLGRIALSVGALPAVFPIHFALLGGEPVFRTDAGAKLSAAASGQVVCLEVDDADTEYHSGWSVMVVGRARIIEDAAELARARLLPLRPWVGSGDSFVRIGEGLVSGRRITGPRPLG